MTPPERARGAELRRVLFVDDEKGVLDGLRRMLRPQRHEWDMTFVSSAEEALERMAEAPFDVLVSDMRMPGMGGARLLAEVQERHPGTVRLILSGHSQEEATLRAVPVAHQFISKPCAPDELRDVVARACALQGLLDDPVIRDAVGGLDTLPPAPRVYRRLCALLADPEVDLGDVADVIEADLGLTAKTLQIVNSSFFGIAREVHSVRDAASYLGTEMLRSLVLSIEVFGRAEGQTLAPSYSIEREHRHGTSVAQIAKRISPDAKTGDQAFLAGMLHDVGKLVFANRLPSEYEHAVSQSLGQGRPQWMAERDVIGVSHAEVGAYLLGSWGFPYPIVEAVAHHHQPSRVENGELGILGVVHVADVLARELESEAATLVPSARLDLGYLEHLGLLEELPFWRQQVHTA